VRKPECEHGDGLRAEVDNLRRTVSQPVCLDVGPLLWHMTGFILLSDVCDHYFVGGLSDEMAHL
jgi:hypothetical protein